MALAVPLEPTGAAPVPATLRQVVERSQPAALAGDQSLPVATALGPLLPQGLRRGATVAVGAGPGATSLALALGVAASAAGSWAALVGPLPVNPAAAGEVGLALERLVVVDPPPEQWSTVVAALLDAVDLVYAGAPGRVPAGDARRLVARARERGAVLIQLPGPSGIWPVAADHRLTVADPSWVGIGDDAGGGARRLEARRATVVAGGRGAASQERRARLWLPDRDGQVRACEEEDQVQGP